MCVKAVFWCHVGILFGSLLAPKWAPNASRWAAWAPCGALEVPYGVLGGPREAQELIFVDLGCHFGSLLGAFWLFCLEIFVLISKRFGDTSGVFRECFGDVSGTFRVGLGDVSGMFRGHFRDVSIMLQACNAMLRAFLILCMGGLLHTCSQLLPFLLQTCNAMLCAFRSTR